MDKRLQIIGLGGTNGSGKDLLGALLAEHHKYLFISVTDLLRDELRARGLQPKREHMRALSAEWRRDHGLGVLVDRAVEALKTAKGTYAGVVMASLRNPYEADRIHELGGTMVWVDADPQIRYARVQSSNRGAERAVDDQKTFEQFLAEEAAEMHPPEGADNTALNMAAVKERADVMLENNSGDRDTFLRDIENALGL